MYLERKDRFSIVCRSPSGVLPPARLQYTMNARKRKAGKRGAFIRFGICDKIHKNFENNCDILTDFVI